MASDPYGDDDLANNLVVTGAVFFMLSSVTHPAITELTIPNGESEPGNAIEIGLDFMASRYRLTVERIAE